MYPESSLLKALYLNLCNAFTKNLERKLKDNNSMKSTSIDPHLRTVVLADIPRLIFSGVFAPKFNSDERSAPKNGDKSSPLFNISTMERLVNIFSSHAAIKCHNSGDVSLITPIAVISGSESSSPDYHDNENSHDNYVPSVGSLVIPLSTEGCCYKCFIPCAGFDPDTNELPTWSVPIKLTTLIPSINWFV